MFVFESGLSLQFSTLMEACLQKFWIASRIRKKVVYKMATFDCTNRHWTTWIFQLVQLQKSNRILFSASLICYKSISYCLHILSLKLRWRKKNCIIWLFVFSVMVRSLPQTAKFLLLISKNCSSLQFYTQTDEHLH